MLNIGFVQADCDFHFVEYGEGVLLYLQSGALNTKTEGNLLNASEQGFLSAVLNKMMRFYLFIKNKVCSCLFLAVEEDRPF